MTGPHLVDLFDTTVLTCRARGDCSTATTIFLSHYGLLQDLGNVLIAVPAVIGIFWGAPLVARELEAGTHRLAWTQSVTRTRWIAVKLTVVGLASLAVTGLFSLMVTWWSSPIDRVNMNQFTSAFAQRGIVPIGYAAFAFTLGVTAGVMIRRTLPAMVATLLGFVTARVVVTFWVRPHFMSAVRSTTPLHMTPGMGFMQSNNGPLGIVGGHPGAWVFSDWIVDKAGHIAMGTCSTGPDVPRTEQLSLAYGTLREVLVYQPASRYWAFQWSETALFVALSLVLAGFCVWSVRDRLH